MATKRHPTYLAMVTEAITNLKEHGGSSRQTITKYIMSNHFESQDHTKVNKYINVALKKGVAEGTLQQAKGSGALGSFKLNKTTQVRKLNTKRIAVSKSPAQKRRSAEEKAIEAIPPPPQALKEKTHSINKTFILNRSSSSFEESLAEVSKSEKRTTEKKAGRGRKKLPKQTKLLSCPRSSSSESDAPQTSTRRPTNKVRAKAVKAPKAKVESPPGEIPSRDVRRRRK